MRRGTNLPAIGGYNQTVVLDLVRRSGEGASRAQLARSTGLSAQTVSNVTRRLLDEGLVREAGTRIDGPGKPSTLITLESRGRVAIGVHLDPALITYVVLDLRGEVIAHSHASPPVGAAPDAIIQEMAAAVEELIVVAAIPRERILGVGIAAPGPIDSEHGVVDPPLLEAWHHVRLRDELADELGLPVLLEKDVTAAVVAERWRAGGEGHDDVVFVYYGTGTGMGLLLGGEIVRGSTGNAGDSGHIIADPDGPLCNCGRRGCVGDATLPRSLVVEARAAGVLAVPPGPLDVDDVDRWFAVLAGAAGAGEPGAVEILGRAAERIAASIVTVVNLLDVDRVVFGGPFWGRLERFFMERIPGLVTDARARVTRHAIVFETSASGDDVAAVGAACLVLDGALTPRPSAMLIR